MTRKTLFALLLTGIVTQACDRGGSEETAKPTDGGDDPVSEQNPLFSPSPLQYQAPDYSVIKTEHFRPAFERGMTDHMAEIQAIANGEEEATFENTIVAMEKSGEIKKRTEDAFFNLTGTMSDPEIQAIEKEMAPKLSAHTDAIRLDAKLFARIEKIYQAREGLEPEQKRLAEKYYENFVRAGAKLDEASKAKVKEINAELSKLTTGFSQALLDATKNNAVVVEDKARLAGLSDAEIAGLAAAAEKAGRKGKYQINLLNTTRQPIISRLDDRELRRQVWEASSTRAAEANGAALLRIVELRAQKAKLLGYPTWAHYVLEAQMAKTPDAVLSHAR